MTDHGNLDTIALTILQVCGLLFPVILITMKYYFNNESQNASEKMDDKAGKSFIAMITFIVLSGLLSTIGILDIQLKQAILFGSIITLTAFWITYGLFIYSLATSKPETN